MSAYDIIRDTNVLNRPSYMPQNGVDYIYSPSRIHFAALEENGEFVIYAGESPDDPKRKKVWSTGASVPSGYEVVCLTIRKGPFDNYTKNMQIFMHKINNGSSLTKLWSSGGSGDLQSPMELHLRDDGNLFLRQNMGGDWKEVWHNEFSDPVVEFIVEAIEYDIPHAKMKSDTQTDVLEQVLENRSDVVQNMTMNQSFNRTTTSSWSNATGFTATIGGEVTSGVPGVASAKVSMSASVQNTFTLGGSKSTSDTVGFTMNLSVPPRTKYRGWATIQTAEFEVPYTVFGELHFKSGRKMRHKLSGIYQGKTGYRGEYHVDDVTHGEHKPVMFFVSEGPASSNETPTAYMIE